MSREGEVPQNETRDRGQDEAARRLQKLWRGKNDAKDKFLTPHARWDEVVGDTALKVRTMEVFVPESVRSFNVSTVNA